MEKEGRNHKIKLVNNAEIDIPIWRKMLLITEISLNKVKSAKCQIPSSKELSAEINNKQVRQNCNNRRGKNKNITSYYFT